MPADVSTVPGDQQVVQLVSKYFDYYNESYETFDNSFSSYQYYGYNNNTTSAMFDWLADPAQFYDETWNNTWFCATGDCVKNCQDVTRMFDGSTPAGFGVCSLFANISDSLGNTELWTTQEVTTLQDFGFGSQSSSVFSTIATDVTQCLVDACQKNPRASKNCPQLCAQGDLLINPNTPSFAGISTCLLQVCSTDLSFADLDLAGIGVSTRSVLPFQQMNTNQLCSHRL